MEASRQARLYGIASAYDGRLAQPYPGKTQQPGRIVCDSSWHHSINININANAVVCIDSDESINGIDGGGVVERLRRCLQ